MKCRGPISPQLGAPLSETQSYGVARHEHDGCWLPHDRGTATQVTATEARAIAADPRSHFDQLMCSTIR